MPSRLRSAALFRVCLLPLQQAGSDPSPSLPLDPHPFPVISRKSSQAKGAWPNPSDGADQPREAMLSLGARDPALPFEKQSEKKAINIICLPSNTVLPP